MGFNLQDLINQAQQVVDQQQSFQKNNMRVIYPGTGTLRVKLLYNPKSNLVARQFRRHRIENVKVPCLSTYGVDCPVCNALNNIKNLTGVDLWKYKSSSRGISFAQYIGSGNGYVWDNSNKEPQVGETIILMYPWSIYQGINRIIASAGVAAEKLIASNEGKILNISRWRENNIEKYNIEVDAFSPDYRSFATDKEFEDYLNNLPDLSETIMSASITPDISKSAKDAADQLERMYISSRNMPGIPTNPNNSGPSQIGFNRNYQNNQYSTPSSPYPNYPNQQMSSPSNPYPAGTTTNTPPWSSNMTTTTPNAQQGFIPPINSQQNNFQDNSHSESSNDTPPWSTAPNPSVLDGPACFGHHKDNDSNCMMCEHEIRCMTIS